jgi:hypothetical protein
VYTLLEQLLRRRYLVDIDQTHFVFWCMVVLSTKSDDRNYKERESETLSRHPFGIYLEDWEIAFLIG